MYIIFLLLLSSTPSNSWGFQSFSFEAVFLLSHSFGFFGLACWVLFCFFNLLVNFLGKEKKAQEKITKTEK